jgi:hypothetical protein
MKFFHGFLSRVKKARKLRSEDGGVHHAHGSVQANGTTCQGGLNGLTGGRNGHASVGDDGADPSWCCRSQCVQHCQLVK